MSAQLNLRNEEGWRYDQRDPNQLAKGLIQMYGEAKRRELAQEGMFRLMASVCIEAASETGEPQFMEWEDTIIRFDIKKQT